ncbi:hypothetical protein ACVBGC_22725 [Burkholderia stagnalis]
MRINSISRFSVRADRGLRPVIPGKREGRATRVDVRSGVLADTSIGEMKDRSWPIPAGRIARHIECFAERGHFLDRGPIVVWQRRVGVKMTDTRVREHIRTCAALHCREPPVGDCHLPGKRIRSGDVDGNRQILAHGRREAGEAMQQDDV